MSGKARQARRTKNNVRPSSSGRSAELLSSTVNPALVQVGPGNLLPALFPSLAGHAMDQPLSNQFLLCFKKFHKKDPITKIKALKELTDLVANSRQDDVVTALGSWAHYYPSLTMDVDRKVREATQTVNGAIVRACGRQVALHIKRLLPAWLMAQHDEHAPVQQIAYDTLHATFPNQKLAEAIKFCKTDICTLYMDNLKGNAEYMLSGKKLDDEEERVAQLARVVSCTLRALRLLVVALPAAHEDWLWEALLPLLCANGYWKLVTHPAPRVRAASYMLTGALLARFPSRLGEDMARRSARSLVTHAESARDVCLERWCTLLNLMFNMPGFLDLVDTNLLVKRLWDVFENAAWGEAGQLAAVLPALLELLPAAMQTEDFYYKWFTALFTGLRQKTFLCNETERDHWSGIIADSLRHVTMVRREPCALRLTDWALRTWLQAVLAAPPLLAATAARAAPLLRDWARLAADHNDSIFVRMVADFWQNVGSAISTDLAGPPAKPDDAIQLIDSHLQFLTALKRELESGDGLPAEEVYSGRCLEDLDRAVNAVIGLVFLFTHEHRLVHRVLPVAVPVLTKFPDSGLVRNLAQKFQTESPLVFYDRVVRGWLADEEQRCETVVDLMFLLLQDLNDKEQDVLFDSFEQLSPEVFRWCLARALRATRGGAQGAARWLRSAAVERALVALVHMQEDAAAGDLLVEAVSHHHHDETGVSEAAVESVVGACTSLLNALVELDPAGTVPAETGPGARRGAHGARGGDPFAALEARTQFAARLVRALPPSRSAAALPLTLSLFRLTLHVPRGSPVLAVEAWTDALWAWRETARLLPRAQRDAFVQDSLGHLHRHLFHDEEKLNIARVEHVVSLCPYFVAGGDPVEVADPAELVAHSRMLLQPAQGGVQPPLAVFALQMDAVWGHLSCPLESDNEWLAVVVAGTPPLSKQTLVAHASRLLFRACYLQVLLRPSAVLLALEYFKEQLCDVLHDYAVLNVLYEHYTYWIHFDIIREARQRLEQVIVDLVSQTSADVQGVLATTLDELAATHGYYWAYSKYHYRRILAAAQSPEQPATADDQQDSTMTSELEFMDAVDVMPARTDSRLSSSSSFEMLDASESMDTNPPSEVVELDSLDDPDDPQPVPLLLEQLRAAVSVRRRSSLARAPKPAVTLITQCPRVEQYVDLLGEMVLMNGYYHEAQMKALEVEKQKRLAKVKFDEQQDAALAMLELVGQAKIFERWSDEPATYRVPVGAEGERTLYVAKDAAMLRAYYCMYATRAPVDVLVADVGAERTVDSAACNLDAVINGYYRYNDTMLFERSLMDASWLELSSMAAVLDLLSEAVEVRGWRATALHWDFTNIALCSTLSSLALSTSMWAADTVRLALVARPALVLFARVRRFISGVRRECTRRLPTAHVAALPREWADIFTPDATKNMYLLICHVLDSSTREVTAAQVAVLQVLTEAAKLLEPSVMPVMLRTGQLDLRRLVRCATRALADTCHHGFKYLAYYTLRTLAPTMIDTDEVWLEEREETAAPHASGPVSGAAGADGDVEDVEMDEAVFSKLTLALYDEHLDQLQELVDAALSNYVLCEDMCEVVPHSDSHAVVLGHLLLGVALHRHCELARGDLALHYHTVYNAHSYVEGILPAALRLLPAPVLHYMAGRLATLPRRYRPWFIRLQDFDISEACTAAGVARLACGAVLRALGGPGSAAARGWWGVQRSRVADALARLVTAAVAPPLVNHQLAELQARARILAPRAKVTVYWSERSAACVLRGEEGRAPSLRVSLSSAHPLHAPRVHGSAAGPDVHWLAVYLGYKNGRVLEGMRMWVEAAGAELQAGVHCYVCYLRVCVHDVGCRQCRNSFHAVCLRRWFNMSNRSMCPVCRTSF